jgi:hypothetical protein
VYRIVLVLVIDCFWIRVLVVFFTLIDSVVPACFFYWG